MPKRIKNPPVAQILMESMRSMGYSFESALADVLDNSVSAGAKNIDILFPSNPSHIYIGIIDDGCGMSRQELIDAMRYGSSGINESRRDDDLGRFGLGLKSASLSQCRKLTVISKKDNEISACCWDLDVVIESKDWELLEYSKEEISSLPLVERVKALSHGTLVIWESFDFVEKASNGNTYYELSMRLKDAFNYISLIFHRFIQKKDGIKFSQNGYVIPSVDPFLERHPKTEPRKISQISILDKNGIDRLITAQAYVLPFQKDLSNDDIKDLGGIEKMNTMQGFYVYRNNRLIVWGTWFNMKPRNELTKYARIKVDIPNSLDDIWSIDIKKQKATLPPIVKNSLIKMVEESLNISRQKNEHRARIKDNNENRLWHVGETREKTLLFKINRQSPLIQNLRSNLPDESFAMVEDVLELIEQCIPYQDMYNAVANNKICDYLSDEEKAVMINKAKSLVNQLRVFNKKKTRIEIISNVLEIQPFSDYSFIKEAFREELDNDG